MVQEEGVKRGERWDGVSEFPNAGRQSGRRGVKVCA